MVAPFGSGSSLMLDLYLDLDLDLDLDLKGSACSGFSPNFAISRGSTSAGMAVLHLDHIY
jgi:hypothetical protein